ncbi:MAG: hypothetical protein MI919_25320, partial [Holophagales bacterium]|nr:hypothetical protein [Holophagales bacterium]
MTFGVLVLALAGTACRRSAAGIAARHLGRIARMRSIEMPTSLDRELAPLEPEKAGAVVRRLAVLLSLTGDQSFVGYAMVLEASADLFDGEVGLDPASRISVLPRLDRFADAVEEYAELASRTPCRWPPEVGRAEAAQVRLFASLLRCESSGHLLALRPRLTGLIRRIEAVPPYQLLQKDLLSDIDSVIATLEPLGRQPAARDRVSTLSHALTQVLGAQDRLAGRSVGASSYAQRFGSMALEALRQMFTQALESIQLRAELVPSLSSKILTTRRVAVVVLELKNVGQGNASRV